MVLHPPPSQLYYIVIMMMIIIIVLLTWAEEIRGLVEEKGLMEEDWNDRDKWKKKII